MVPTLGSLVMYRPSDGDELQIAFICKRVDDTTANLFLIDGEGKCSAVQGATLLENKEAGCDHFVPPAKHEKAHAEKPHSHHKGHGKD